MPSHYVDGSSLTVDSHAHLFMEEGLPFLFRGSFFGPLRAASWKNRFSSQANVETLEQSGIGLIVVALYAHPWLTNQRKSIRKQINLAEKFIKENPRWIIAKNPDEAWEAYKKGKKIMILSLEEAAGVLETEDDIKVFIDELGIRIVTLLHLYDDHLGGAALMGSYRHILNIFGWLRSFFKSSYDSNKIRLNRKGLTQKGETLAQVLMKHHVWIDVNHASTKSYNQLLPLLKKAKQPLLFSHLTPREFRQAESGISGEQLQEVKNTGGIVGLIPSKEIVQGNSQMQKKYPDAFQKFSMAYKRVVSIIGEQATVIGSDLNGPLTRLPPTIVKTNTRIDTEGFWHIGHTKDLWQALENIGVKTLQPRCKSIEFFLNAWSQVWQ